MTKRRLNLITQAIMLLRKAGIRAIFETDSITVKAITDDLEFTWEEPDGCQLVIDGVDLTSRLQIAQVTMIPGRLPTVMCVFDPRPGQNINTLVPDSTALSQIAIPRNPCGSN